MTKTLKTMALMLMTVVGAGMVADGALGQVTMRFDASRDIGILAHALEQLSSAGDAGRIRPLKNTQNAAIVDFDGGAIATFLTANPGVVTAELFIQPADGLPVSGDIGVQTVESTNDWVEGDGDGNGGARNWTAGTSSATYFYAATALDGAGLLDTANSLEWIDPDSGPYTFTVRNADHAAWSVPAGVGGGGLGANPTPEFTNSTDFLAADLLNAFGNGEYASVDIDANIINAIATDVNNRGLRFGEVGNNTESSNWRIYDKNQSGGLFTPYLEVTVSPSTGQDGDFDGDLDVDGADFLKWQRDGADPGDFLDWEANYGTPAPLLGGFAAVPEPSSIALLLLSSAMLLGRRNLRRSL